ncbi:hypothetical protein B0H13DRAFT_2344390 [Mycena leptocephala]|nr:hypothetical protein B0H13DRAFT_2344390 [Mycena leptocephala]
MTVAIYQGDCAEEEWRRDVARYMLIRHPNIIQLHSAASSNNIHATVFHGGMSYHLQFSILSLTLELDLIPFEQFLDHHSPILKVYIYGYCDTDFMTARGYFSSVFQRELSLNECTFWIHRSSGRLCMDLIPANSEHLWNANGIGVSPLPGIKPSEAQNQEATAIDALTIKQYHEICYWDLSRDRQLYCSASATVNLHTIIACPLEDRLEDWVEIAHLPDAEVYLDNWRTTEGVGGEVMEGGWTRFATGDIGGIIWLDICGSGPESWLSQAYHIFSRLGITSNFEEYGTWPECPAYWSLDPSGVEHLSMEDTTALGFPTISLFTEIWEGPGMPVFMQDCDVARHRGEKLYQLSSELNAQFAHVDDEYLYSDKEDQDPFSMDESDDTRLVSEDDDESTDTEEDAVQLPPAKEEASRAEQVQDPLDIEEAENSQSSSDNHHGHITALAFGLARVFAHLTPELRISTPTPNTALGRRTLWLVAHKGTGREQSERRAERVRARLAAHSIGKPIAKTECKGSIGKDFLRSPATNYTSTRQSRPSRTPSRRGGRRFAIRRARYDTARAVRIPCIAVWENDYGTGNRRCILSFVLHWRTISHSRSLRFHHRAQGLTRAMRVEPRISISTLGTLRRRLPARTSIPKAASCCTHCMVGCRDDMQEKSAQQLECARPNSSAMGWDGMETVCTDDL